MSTYSQAWHSTDPAIRDFWRNYATQLTGLCGPDDTVDPADPDRWFNLVVAAFHRYRGYHVAQRNWSYQLADSGSFHNNSVAWTDNYLWTPRGWEPATDYLWGNDLADQWTDVPLYAWNYPHIGIRVKRSYWTGKPRRRRNRS